MLEKIDATVESWIEEAVAHGDDDALFASGYLQGHIAVVLSELEAQEQQDLAALDAKMVDCLALADDELNQSDYALIDNAWQQLRERIVAAI
ncbi:YfcL family protein [Shewanella sp. WXL01]|uniref:YfcL family protein n=1 Tax=Shewanella maritima TaxID=2520507 RepID=A0A411PKR6_9GAMM|nr:MULTISPECIES: YfcL family protein [Shewanella]NKF51157.1 YfcL family protein [Shewanella sp. WXL01]QBF84106.1 YfcL family protein [Shewanella maritima]